MATPPWIGLGLLSNVILDKLAFAFVVMWIAWSNGDLPLGVVMVPQDLPKKKCLLKRLHALEIFYLCTMQSRVRPIDCRSDPTLSDRSVWQKSSEWVVPRPALTAQPFLLHYRCCAGEVPQTELLPNRQSAASCSFTLNKFSVLTTQFLASWPFKLFRLKTE